MTSVCITSEYRTIIYYDASFDQNNFIVNMLRIRRKGMPVICDATIPHDRLAN